MFHYLLVCFWLKHYAINFHGTLPVVILTKDGLNYKRATSVALCVCTFWPLVQVLAAYNMKHIFMLLVLGTLISAAVCAPVSSQAIKSDHQPSQERKLEVISRKKRSENADAAALVQALLKISDKMGKEEE